MVTSNLLYELSVKLTHTSYPIYVGEHLLHDRNRLSQHIAAKHVFIISNTTVAPFYLNQLKKALCHFHVAVHLLDDGEQYKNQQSLFSIYDDLIRLGHNRDTTIIALGGGVVGDISGLVAATYQRGVRFIQIPTTLLAQVDASVGGKTAINLPQAKNMMGVFYQPHAVFIDLVTLETLPLRELKAGIAEVIKYALLVGGDFLELLRDALINQALPFSKKQLAQIIVKCCEIKAGVVQRDEREEGERALLNLGHTFAHALESVTHYQRWLHGEAVAIGLYCAGLLSCQQGYLAIEHVRLIEALLDSAGLPKKIPKSIDSNQLKCAMLRDKKVKEEVLRFVLLRAPGDCYLDENVTMDALDKVLLSAEEGDESNV